MFGGSPDFTAAPYGSRSSTQVARIQFETTGALELVPSRRVEIFKIAYIYMKVYLKLRSEDQQLFANFTVKPLVTKLLRTPKTGADDVFAATA